MTQQVFVGYDNSEDIAFQVCEYSIKRFNPIVQINLANATRIEAKKSVLEGS